LDWATCEFLIQEIANNPLFPVSVIRATGPLPPGDDSNGIASLHTCLASARTVNRMDTVARHKRMIDRLKRKEEEELEAWCLN